MRTVLKHIVANTYKPLLVKYLSRTRVYRYGNLKLEVPPQVFHPGFFFSSQLLLEYVSRLKLNGHSFLEPGAGSGLISFYAAQNGARVTATDINPVAIEYLHKNSKKNKVDIRVIQSDLFDRIPKEQFDIIAINPPYYRKDPETWKDHAWYCGKNGEFFSRFFNELSYYIHKDSITLMILSEGCDLKMIRSSAERNNFSLNLVLTRQNILEKNFIYKIEKQL